jgi:hypothetical protein
MSASVFSYFTSFWNKTGDALIGREALTQLAQFTLGTVNSLTALAGGGQPGATQLAYGDNEVDTVVTNNDSVQLPLALPGAVCDIYNASAQTLSIYANQAPNSNNAQVLDQMVATNTLTKTAAASAITLATGHTTSFMCSTAGLWKQWY